MSYDSQPGPAIRPGYPWSLQIETPQTAFFPSSMKISGQFRAQAGAAQVLASISTEQGGVVRITDQKIELRLTPQQTAQMEAGVVVFDLIRTDTDPKRHLYIEITVPVRTSITQAS